jgi:hypothetical protein
VTSGRTAEAMVHAADDDCHRIVAIPVVVVVVVVDEN